MLRSAPRRFVDRDEERRELFELVSATRAQGPPGVFVLQGIGGVGKTALMLWCASELKSAFDLVLEVSMGASAEAKSVEQILDAFLLRLNARVTPPTLEGKLAVYQAETAGRDVLVVLDDVDSAESVEMLVPESPGSVVLATSRQRLEAFEVKGFVAVPLDVLSERHGVELLSEGLDPSVVEEDQAALAGIARLSGCLPLALTIVGAQLRSRRWERPATVLGRLESERDLFAGFKVDGERKLEFVYEASYRALDAVGQKLYRRLGLHPGLQFGVWILPVLLDEGERFFADDALLALRRWTLVGDGPAGRQEMHSIIYRHAQGLAGDKEPAADVREVRRRLAEAYLDYSAARVLVLSNRLHVGPRFDGRLDPAYAASAEGYRRASADLEIEVPNLRRVVAMAAEEGFADLTWQLAEALGYFLFQRSRYRDAIAVHTRGLAAARQVREQTGEARPLIVMHTELGKACYSVREHEEAARHFAAAAERIAELDAGPDKLTMLAKTYVWQGLVHDRLERCDAAVADFERSAELVADPGFPRRLRTREERLLDMNSAPILAKTGRWGQAVAAAERAVAHFESDGDRANYAKSLANLGEVLAAAGDARAETVLRSALALEKELGIADFEPHTTAILGRLLKHAGRAAEGNGLLARAAKLYELLADLRAEALRADIEDTD